MHWRKATWAILIWTGLAVALGVLMSLATATATGKCLDQLKDPGCRGVGVLAGGVFLGTIFFVWFVGFVILSIVWFMSRPARRLCPACGTPARKGDFVCSRCHYDFRGGQTVIVAPQGPPPWAQQPPQGPPPGWGQPPQPPQAPPPPDQTYWR